MTSREWVNGTVPLCRNGPVGAGNFMEPAHMGKDVCRAPPWPSVAQATPLCWPETLWLAKGQGLAGEVQRVSVPVGPREAFPGWLLCALAGSRSLCSCWNDLQKGRGLHAVPLLPCWMLQGAGTLLRGIFLLSLQKECSCRS